MKEDGWQEWETNYKGGDKKKWRQGKVRKQLEGEPREAAGDLQGVLQGSLPKEKAPQEIETPRGNKQIKPEMAAENF